MSSRSFAPAHLCGVALILVLFALGVAVGQTGAAPYLVPADVGVERAADFGGIRFEGLSGFLVDIDAAKVSAVEDLGAVPIALAPGETCWVYLVEDGRIAEFEPPARVLHRSGHEVFLATDGATPMLTASSRSALQGLKQPVRIPDEPRPLARRVDAPPAQKLNDPLIQQMVNELTQTSFVASWQPLDDFETRYTLAPQSELATQWILDQFRSYGLRAEFHYYQQSGQRRNVIATLPGYVDSTQVVYICGHMDSISDTPTVCAPGADDNASGTVAVLEAARIMSQYQFQYTIKFAAFNGEEQGLLGSAAYCNDISNAGENVIAAFNCDMIAYRGTDTGLPDLVIYTNTASQALATTMTNAISMYVPNALEPIVHVEALSGSDHASFWSKGYRAICSIEDEAWGSDFCPWYHTCNDRIERYPQDYCTYCARANLAAVAMTAVPFAPAGPFLAMGSVVVDDDNLGGSSGNGDGIPNPGETIQLTTTVRNLGLSAATGVSGVLHPASSYAAAIDTVSAWNDIPPSGQGQNLTQFRFQVAGDAPDGEDLDFTLTMTDQTGDHPLTFSLQVAAPFLAYRSHVVDDATHGNGNGVADPGEVLVLPVTLANTGGQEAASVVALMSTTSGRLTIIDESATAALIPSGGQGVLAPGYRVAVSALAVDGEDLAMTLSITAGNGYTAQTGFEIRVGSFFVDEVEADAGWSLSVPDDNATTGRWVRVDPNGTQQSGQQVQPEDDHTPAPGTICFVTGQGQVGGSAGEADVDGGKTTLTSPVFNLLNVVNPRVTYWRWYTNNLGNNPNEDTWLVQVSSNGGTSWVDLERTTVSANSWQQKSFVLSSYITPTSQVVFRFVASDVGAGGSLVEAAVDDFEIDGTLSPVNAPDAEARFTLSLGEARPNPAIGGATIAFALPRDGHALVRVFGVDGRLVRTLADGGYTAGPHEIVWDGRNDAGKRVGPGLYFYKLVAEGREINKRVTILR